MAMHADFDSRPYDYQDDGDLYDQLQEKADRERDAQRADLANDRLRHDRLAQHLRELTEACSRGGAA